MLISWAVAAVIATAAAATNGFLPDEVELAYMARKEERQRKRWKDQLANGTMKEFEKYNASWIDHLRVFKYSELAQRMPLLAGIVASTQRISRRAGLGPLTNQQRL